MGALLISIVAGKFITNYKIVTGNQNNGLKYMIAGTILGPVAGVSLSLLSLSYMKVVEVQTIFALLPIFVLPLNYFYYKEKITLASILASLTAVAGVFILIWRDAIEVWI
jgi:drug/metabolite transporter (DMT)-like permease